MKSIIIVAIILPVVFAVPAVAADPVSLSTEEIMAIRVICNDWVAGPAVVFTDTNTIDKNTGKITTRQVRSGSYARRYREGVNPDCTKYDEELDRRMAAGKMSVPRKAIAQGALPGEPGTTLPPTPEELVAQRRQWLDSFTGRK